MLLSRTKYRRQLRGAAATALIPNLLDRAGAIIRSGYSFPKAWKAMKLVPPKEVINMGKLKEIKMPYDDLVKNVVRRIPMLRKEHLDFADSEFAPIAVRFAMTQHALMQEKKISEAEAFAECEEKIFKEELNTFAKEIRRAPGSYFKLTDKEAMHFQLHDLINAKSYAATAASAGAGTSDLDYRTALNAVYNAPVASPVRALALAPARQRPYLEQLLARYHAAAAEPEAAASAEVLAAYGSAEAVAAAARRLSAALASGDLSAESLAKVEGERDVYGRVLARAADGTLYRRLELQYSTPTFAETGRVHLPRGGEAVTELVDGIDRDARVGRFPAVRYTERQRYVAGAKTLPLDVMLEVIKAAEAVPDPERPMFNPERAEWSPDLLEEDVEVRDGDATVDLLNVDPDEESPLPMALSEQRTAYNPNSIEAAKLTFGHSRYGDRVSEEGRLLHRAAAYERALDAATEAAEQLSRVSDALTFQAELANLGSGGAHAAVTGEGDIEDPVLVRVQEAEMAAAELASRIDDELKAFMAGEDLTLADVDQSQQAKGKRMVMSRAINLKEHLLHSEILKYQEKMEVRRQVLAQQQQQMEREKAAAQALADAQRKAATEAAMLRAKAEAEAANGATQA